MPRQSDPELPNDLSIPAFLDRRKTPLPAAPAAPPLSHSEPHQASNAARDEAKRDEAMRAVAAFEAERRRIKTHNRIGKLLAVKNDRTQIARGARWDARRCRWLQPTLSSPKGARRRESKTRSAAKGTEDGYEKICR